MQPRGTLKATPEGLPVRSGAPGLHAFLDRLEAQLAGQLRPDWLARFGEPRAQYPEWSGHAPPPGE